MYNTSKNNKTYRNHFKSTLVSKSKVSLSLISKTTLLIKRNLKKKSAILNFKRTLNFKLALNFKRTLKIKLINQIVSSRNQTFLYLARMRQKRMKSVMNNSW